MGSQDPKIFTQLKAGAGALSKASTSKNIQTAISNLQKAVGVDMGQTMHWRRMVFTHQHPPGGYPKGQEWAKRYFHIVTPDKAKNSEMFFYKVYGYSYGISDYLEFHMTGYLYGGAKGVNY